MLIIPAIDLRNGACVRLTQGRKDHQKVYDGDPVQIAAGFQEQGAQMLHVVDLDGAFSDPNSRNRIVVREIVRQVTIPVQFGGGLRSFSDVEEVFGLGVERVVIGTLAVESPQLLETLIKSFGSKVCVGIDADRGQVVTRGWERRETISAVELARRIVAAGVERIVYTDVARDGMLTGVDLEQTRLIARESGLKVTASGGVASLEDLRRLSQLSDDGVDSVIIGKALYESRFSLSEALEITRKTEGNVLVRGRK
jgi:phosphoribosylformimino-5-aminoimidazole carboxamide ribotide isomerase